MKENFTTLEKELLFKFFDKLKEHQGNAGCNDCEIPNTPEGVAIHESGVRAAMSKKDADQWLTTGTEHTGETICTTDSFVLAYLRAKLERIL